MWGLLRSNRIGLYLIPAILVVGIGFCCYLKQDPLVSVVIPVYNREELLPRAVDSVSAQTYHRLEIIIVDDGSTDQTLSVARALAQKDKRIRVIAAPHVGRWGARNTGLDTARGKYIAYQDSDDVSVPHRIERLVSFLEENKQVDVVGTAYSPIGISAPPFDSITITSGLHGEQLRLVFLLGGNPAMQPTIMMRRAFLQDNHIRYRKEQSGLEDLSLYDQIYEHNGYIVNLPEPLYQYKLHGDNPKSVYKEEMDFVKFFYNDYWNRFFPDTERSGDFCERLSFVAKQNKTRRLFSDDTVSSLQQKLCPDGQNLFDRFSVVLRIDDNPEIVIARQHDSTFYSYLMKQRGRLLFQKNGYVAVEWTQDKVCGFYPTYWSEKWKKSGWED